MLIKQCCIQKSSLALCSYFTKKIVTIDTASQRTMQSIDCWVNLPV